MKYFNHAALALFMLPWSAVAEFMPERSFGDIRLSQLSRGQAYYAGLFHIYDAALYTRGTAANEAPRCLSLTYHVPLSRDKLILAAEKTLRRQGVDPNQLQPQLGQLHDHFRDVAEGDSYTLCQLMPDTIQLYYNGREQVSLSGEAFAHSYLGIWLGENSISSSLRAALLTPLAQQPGR